MGTTWRKPEGVLRTKDPGPGHATGTGRKADSSHPVHSQPIRTASSMVSMSTIPAQP